MATTQTATENKTQPAEDFSFDVYTYLELRIQAFRTIVMNSALRLAKKDCESSGSTVKVRYEHVDEALLALLEKYPEVLRDVLLPNVSFETTSKV